MDNIENKIEEIISRTGVKTTFCNKLNAYLTPNDRNLIDIKIEELISSNPNSSFEEILKELYTHISTNLPDEVNEKLRGDIVEFINQNVDLFQ